MPYIIRENPDGFLIQQIFTYEKMIKRDGSVLIRVETPGKWEQDWWLPPGAIFATEQIAEEKIKSLLAQPPSSVASRLLKIPAVRMFRNNVVS